MNRRAMIASLFAAAAVPASVGAQFDRTQRILWLSTGADPDPLLDRFRDGLLSNGLIEGRHVSVEIRYASDAAALEPVIAELPRGNFDLVVLRGAQAIRATRLIKNVPVLFAMSGDPVELGVAKSLAHPGGNSTGATFLSLDLAAKRVELCKELLPDLSTLAVLSNTDHPGERSEWRVTKEAALSLGVRPHYMPFAGAAELDRALGLRRTHADAMLVFPDGVTYVHRTKIADVALQSAVPSIFGWRDYAEAGGLLSYGPDQYATYHWLAGYAARVLRGERAGDLPVQQPTSFELILNLKTAHALGLTIPPTLLARADKVIE
jgi:putative ABC transport system substrate-binding protein